MILAFVVVLSAQAPDPSDIPPPPPPLGDPADAVVAEPQPVVVEPPSDPSDLASTAAPKSLPGRKVLPVPSVKVKAKLPPRPKFEPLSPWLVGCMQSGTVMGSLVAGTVLTVLGAFGGPAGMCIAFCVALPASCVGGSYGALVIGDRFGPGRGDLVSTAMAYGGSLGVSAAGVVLIFIGYSLSLTTGGIGAAAATLIGLVLAVGGIASTPFSVPITYALTATPKGPNDDGSDAPRIMRDSAPPPPPGRGKRRASAMLF